MNDAEASTSQTAGGHRRPSDQDILLNMQRENQGSGAWQKKVSSVILFLKTMLSFLKDEWSIFELGRFMAAYESMPDVTATRGKSPVGAESLLGDTTTHPLIVKGVNQVSRKPRISHEFWINAQIGDYDIEDIVIDLGSDVNVMPRGLGK